MDSLWFPALPLVPEDHLDRADPVEDETHMITRTHAALTGQHT